MSGSLIGLMNDIVRDTATLNGAPCPECLSAGRHASTCSTLNPPRQKATVELPIEKPRRAITLQLLATWTNDGSCHVSVLVAGSSQSHILDSSEPFHHILNQLVKQCEQLKAVA